jgi:hypothetical protein
MGANSVLYLTAADWAKRLDPQGNTADIVELLSQTNEVLEDMTFMECNNLTSHEITQRTGLPAVYYRQLNAGVLPSKSTTAQVVEGTSILECFSQVDCDIVDKNKNPKKFRLTEALAHIEAMNQRQATTLFYGNAGTAPEEFTGLATRYSSLTAGNASNVINAGGLGSDNASIYLVTWGDTVCSGIFPTGTKVGMKHVDNGKVLIQNANGVTGALLNMYVDQWKWDMGLALPDWRGVNEAAPLKSSLIDLEARKRVTGGKPVAEMQLAA